jgi:transketolase
MPSSCRFARASVAEQEAVLPRAVPRVIVEAAATFGWHRFAGDSGTVVGIDHFGASAPAPRLFQEFGITAAHVAAAARAVLARARTAT